MGPPTYWEPVQIDLLWKMKTAPLASESAETWNQKNFASDDERSDDSYGETARILRELPSAALGVARRRPGTVLLVAAAIVGAVGLAWYFSNRD